MEEGRNKKLVKDIFIYGIGNLGAKIITFAIFPVYTFFIRPDDLGYYDLSVNAILFLLPFINLQLRDGVFRFLIDNKDDRKHKAVISAAYLLIIRMIVIASILFALLQFFIDVRCGYYIFAFLISWAFYEVQIQIVRGLGHTKFFVLCGVLTAFLILVFSLIFIIILRMDIEGVFLANIAARVVVILIIETKLSLIIRYATTPAEGSKDITSALLKFCTPLILTASLLWLIGNSNRFIIQHLLGQHANGIYATVFKFAQIIELLSIVIFQAWQEMSVLQFEAEDRDKYYSSVFNSYLLILSGIVVTISLLLKIFYVHLVGAEYGSSVIYLYILCVANIGYALQSFMSAIFQAQKNTIKLFYASVFTVVISIVINYLLIKHIGLTGAAISYGISYFLLFAFNFGLARGKTKISVSSKVFIVSAAIVTGSGFVFYCTENVLLILAFWLVSLVAVYLCLPPAIINWITTKFKRT
ncbi:MAG: polysaccharide biosynthesis C-terminal domain-containing protein [Tannerella sp.]|jgi:O-antigen/teichoic acid export membrane protein|nr:polysaccharide biosynthesis C-terminal domain-containing protein [Tannerella sp.]